MCVFDMQTQHVAIEGSSNLVKANLELAFAFDMTYLFKVLNFQLSAVNDV